MKSKTRNTKKNGDRLATEAAGHVGQKAYLHRGIIRGEVRCLTFRMVYGRIEYLVANENEEHEWVRAASVSWAKTTENNNEPKSQPESPELRGTESGDPRISTEPQSA